MTRSIPTVDISTPPLCDAAALFVRRAGELEVTVIAKLAFSLEHDVATPVARVPLAVRDAHRDRSPLTSLEAASDWIPPLPHPEFLVVGHAYSAGGMLTTQVNVQAQIADQAVIARKRIVAMGLQRGGAREPFARMPLVWERALRTAENPVGSDAPTLFDPNDPRRAAGFGPVAPIWPSRRARLGAATRGQVEGALLELPEGFDPSYFQAAPHDQWLARFRGDEWVLLDGLHRTKARVQTRLPGAAVVVRSNVSGDRPLALRPDRLVIDTDRAELHVTYRRSLPVRPDTEKVVVEIGIAFGGREPTFAAEAPTRQHELPPSVRPFVTGGTVAIDEVKIASPATPFESKASTTQALPDLPDEPTVLPFTTPVLRPASTESPGQLSRASVAQQAASTQALPDLPDDQAPLPFAPSRHPSEPPRGATPTRVELPWKEARGPVVAAAMAVTTLELPDLPESSDADAASGDPPEPGLDVARAISTPRPSDRGDGLPVRAAGVLAVASFPWVVDPPKTKLVVVAKLSASLEQGRPARLLEDPTPLSGDAFVADDPEGPILRASDFSVWKRHADVLVVGHAYPPRDAANASRVALRLKGREGVVDKELAVFGERVWQGQLGQTSPLPFEKISLGYESAFGGTSFALNPIGRGHRGSADRALPNLEAIGERITSPDAEPSPMALGPVHPLAHARWAGIGTYGSRWVETRWPYLAEDHDPVCQQLAPADQRVPSLSGDEPFELVGVFADRPGLAGQLPGVAVRVFARTLAPREERRFEIAMRLDTVVFKPDEDLVDLTFRGSIDVSDDDAPEFDELVAIVVPLGIARTDAEVDEAIAALAPEEIDLSNPEPSPAPPVEDPEAAADAEREKTIHAAIAEAERDAGVTPLDPSPPRSSQPLDQETAQRLREAGASDEELRVFEAASRGDHAEGEVAASRPDLRALVLQLIAEDKPLRRLDLRGADLSGLDLSSRDFTESDLSGARLEESSLEGSVFSDASLRKSNLVRANASRARFHRADLHAATLSDASFEAADLEEADLSFTTGVRVDFTRAVGAQSNFERTELEESVFTEVDLPKADFSSSRLLGAAFAGAGLAAACFYDAEISFARFDRANLRNLRADAARAEKSSFVGAMLDDSVWERADLTDATFERAELANANLVRVKAPRARFDGADLGSARLTRGGFESASFVGANLHEATLDRANLSSANLSLANLHEASLERSRLVRTNFTDAIMSHRSKSRQP